MVRVTICRNNSCRFRVRHADFEDGKYDSALHFAAYAAPHKITRAVQQSPHEAPIEEDRGSWEWFHEDALCFFFVPMLTRSIRFV